MTGEGRVERVFIAPDGAAAMRERSNRGPRGAGGSRRSILSRGRDGNVRLVGAGGGTSCWLRPDIELEAIDAIEREADIRLAPGERRRNIETRNVALNHLVGERFQVGEAICLGRRLCEPCEHLQRITHDGVLGALVHRGGLRADILDGGRILPGDAIARID